MSWCKGLCDWVFSKLVDDILLVFRRWSVQVQVVVAALGVYFLTLPEKLQDAIPHQILVAVSTAGAAATIITALVKQKSLAPGDK